jgi:Protein of unknown function (DUF3311)
MYEYQIADSYRGIHLWVALHYGCSPVKRPSAAAVAVGLIPFAAMCFSVPLWDRVDPMFLGLPFNLFWLISWIPLSTFCMWIAYGLEAARDDRAGGIQ